MKKIIFTLLAISLLSCSLEKRPDTAWGEDDYFKTEGQLKSLLNGGYVCMQKALGAGASIYGDMRADIYYCSRTSAVDFDNIINNNIQLKIPWTVTFSDPSIKSGIIYPPFQALKLPFRF